MDALAKLPEPVTTPGTLLDFLTFPFSLSDKVRCESEAVVPTSCQREHLAKDTV
jgi:hypothetical protein